LRLLDLFNCFLFNKIAYQNNGATYYSRKSQKYAVFCENFEFKIWAVFKSAEKVENNINK